MGLVLIRDRWATDAPFMARWTLEAFGSTQLRHPNLACPFAVRAATDRIFAEAWVDDSAPLSDPTRGRATLDRQARVSAILHAARGLRFAHEQGVFHRDLNLAAIRVDAEGRITVTGVGVGLVPEAPDATPSVSISLREPPVSTSPSPPSPDARSDVAALGQALSTMVSGASGERAVPPGLVSVIRRMVGGSESDRADDRERFRDMGAVVRALEAELGVAAPWKPTEEEAEVFDSALLDYQAAPLAPLRRWIGLGALIVLGLIVAALVASGHLWTAVGWVVFGTLIAVALAGFQGFDARDRINRRVAAALAVIARRDLFALALAVVGVVGVLVVTHGWMTWVSLTIFAVGLAASYHFGVDRPLERSRAGALTRLRALIRSWRRVGVEEAVIHRYLAGAGGKGWEEPFAALFGLGEVAKARAIWGLDLSGQARPRFAVFRAWVLGRVDALILGRVIDQTRGLLEPIIERDLEARGMHVLTARRKGKRAAEAVVAVARQYRQSPDESVGLPLLEAFRKAVDHPEEFLLSPEIAEAAEPSGAYLRARFYFETLFGRRLRFLLGLIALAGALLWMERNALVSFDQLQRVVQSATLEGDWSKAAYNLREMGKKFTPRMVLIIEDAREPDALQVSFLPLGVTSLFNGFALLASGLILLASSLVGGVRIIFFALCGALLPLIPWLIFPPLHPLGPLALTAMAVGAGVFAVGVIWNRSKEF